MLPPELAIYVRPAKRVAKEFFNIGIRIGYDAMVTANGCELMECEVSVRRSRLNA